MKSKYLLGILVVCALFTLDACKSKESAYKAAYEAAKAKELQEEANVTFAEKPTVSDAVTSAIVLKETITVVDNFPSIQQYNVVIGSFTNKTNALSLQERMTGRGYSAVLAQNEKGMYRVIAATFGNKTDAAMERDNIRKNYPEFEDAWILDKN
ncbi:MAG: SPOR domain-containing protein [Dysgonamonadaceae bacterium]|jgi:cell division protein FtsN|nr:SPOR domain-containing protein [Dysgonamonadaceae bacterium]